MPSRVNSWNTFDGQCFNSEEKAKGHEYHLVLEVLAGLGINKGPEDDLPEISWNLEAVIEGLLEKMTPERALGIAQRAIVLSLLKGARGDGMHVAAISNKAGFPALQTLKDLVAKNKIHQNSAEPTIYHFGYRLGSAAKTPDGLSNGSRAILDSVLACRTAKELCDVSTARITLEQQCKHCPSLHDCDELVHARSVLAPDPDPEPTRPCYGIRQNVPEGQCARCLDLTACEDTRRTRSKARYQHAYCLNRVQWLVYRYYDHMYPEKAPASWVSNVERVEDPAGTDEEIREAIKRLKIWGIIKSDGHGRIQFVPDPKRTIVQDEIKQPRPPRP